MPKSNKETINENNQCTSKNTAFKRWRKTVFKFDIQKILKERQLDERLLKLTAKLDEEMKVIDALYQEKVNQTFDIEDNDQNSLVSSNLDNSKTDRCNYNISFKESSDSDLTCIERLQIMAIEENELAANIHFNHLMKANWSPVFDDVQNILYKWRVDLDPNSLSLEYGMKNYENIGRHNFELVINFTSYSILKNSDNFTVDELLTLAKYIVTISLDHLCGQMINVIKRFFSACIETALKKDDGPALIAFAEELYLKYNEDDLLKMIVDLFLPLEGQITKTMYTYLTFKLYKSLLGKMDDTSAFPSSINEWFVQDLVGKNYFNTNPKKVLYSVIQLLEHVVVIFDLYKEEDKLNSMYNFLNAAVKPTGLLDSQKLVNILDQWRLQLFRLHVNRKSGY